jgi:hypothetical protein
MLKEQALAIREKLISNLKEKDLSLEEYTLLIHRRLGYCGKAVLDSLSKFVDRIHANKLDSKYLS